jgi:hypothetical protein
VGPDGSIYVADGTLSTDPVVVSRYSNEGALLAHWGEPGGGPGQFRAIRGLAVDRGGTVYVSDHESDRLSRADYTRIQLFTQDGVFLSSREVHAAAPGQALPWYYEQLTTDGFGNLIAALDISSPSQGHGFRKFDPAGVLRSSWDAPVGVGIRQIAADGAGDVLAADDLNYQAVVFSAQGVFLGAWGAYGSGPSQFREPYGIALDRNGDAFVLDRGQSSFPQVQKFATSVTPTTRTTWGRVKELYR